MLQRSAQPQPQQDCTCSATSRSAARSRRMEYKHTAQLIAQLEGLKKSQKKSFSIKNHSELKILIQKWNLHIRFHMEGMFLQYKPTKIAAGRAFSFYSANKAMSAW